MADDDQTDPATSAEEKEIARFLEDYMLLMDNAQFRRWLWHVVDDKLWCAAHACRENPDNVNETFLIAGRRGIGVQLLVQAQKVNAKMTMNMIREAMGLQIERAAMSPMG